MHTFTLEAAAQKTSKLALALVAALALVVSLLAPVSPAHASGTPSITGVSPSAGVTGATVTITGSVAGVTRVDFGTVAGTSLVIAGNSLTVVAPPQTSGSSPYSIKLTSPTGVVTLNGAFTYRSTMAPSVSAVSPATGLATGYNTVVISGSNFTGASAVRFGATSPVAAISFSVLSDSRISAVVPEGLAGASVRVSVVTPGGTSTSLVNYSYKTTTCVPGRYLTTTFNYRSSTLTTAQIRKIRAAADELVLLGCESVQLVRYTGVRAGSPAAYKSYLTLSNRRANNIVAVFAKRLSNRGAILQVSEVKRASQKSQRRVANWDSRASYRKLFIRVAVSEGIDIVSPSAGPTTGGGTVVITGRGFTNLAATGAVRFGLNASPSYTVNLTGTKITATVPAGLASNTSVSIQRGVPGTSTAKVFTRAYSYVASPTITSLNLTAGSIVGGTSVTITGTNFTGVTGVSFGSARALSYTVNSSTSITAVAPSGVAGTTAIASVTAAGGTVSSGGFTYLTAPSISGITWSSAGTAPGTLVINGSGFTSATQVTVAGTNLLSTATIASGTISIPGIAQPASGEIVVTTALGQASFSVARPTVSNATWTSAAGGTLIITGTGFTGATAATVNNVSVFTSATVAPMSITKTGVAQPASGHLVVVTTPSGASAAYTFIRPDISAVTWTAADGGTLVITGTEFTGATAATVNGASVFTGATVAPTSITKTGVAQPAAGHLVVVTTPANPSNSFSFIRPDISAVTWTAADGGTLVITGTGFTGATAATVNGASVFTGATVTSTTITKTNFGAQPTAAHEVAVTTPVNISNLFAYVEAVS